MASGPDYIDLLRELVLEHYDDPAWTYERYAHEVTEGMRKRQGYQYRAIPPGTIGNTITRYRYAWQIETGRDLSPRQIPRADLIPWKLDPRFRMDTIVRKLRNIDRLRRGQEVPREVDARQARKFEAKLRAERCVVDLDADTGRPIVREAEPHELTEDGELIEIVARPRSKTAA